jgi:hypothetical protein
MPFHTSAIYCSIALKHLDLPIAKRIFLFQLATSEFQQKCCHGGATKQRLDPTGDLPVADSARVIGGNAVATVNGGAR